MRTDSGAIKDQQNTLDRKSRWLFRRWFVVQWVGDGDWFLGEK